MTKGVDFDDYENKYELLLEDQLAFFSKDRGYFSEYKVALTKKLIGTSPDKVLDFGCGIGLTLPLFKSGYCLFFPQSLKLLRSAEKLLCWLPLGGQHYILARK